MSTFLMILSIAFGLLGITFSILPMGTIAIIPITMAMVAAFVHILRNRTHKLPRLVLLFVFLNLLFVVGREVLVKDTVVVDEQFEQVKQQSEEESKQILEELESLPQ